MLSKSQILWGQKFGNLKVTHISFISMIFGNLVVMLEVPEFFCIPIKMHYKQIFVPFRVTSFPSWSDTVPCIWKSKYSQYYKIYGWLKTFVQESFQHGSYLCFLSLKNVTVSEISDSWRVQCVVLKNNSYSQSNK